MRTSTRSAVVVRTNGTPTGLRAVVAWVVRLPTRRARRKAARAEVLEALTQFQTALTECHRIVTLSPMDGLVEFDNVPICLEMMRDGVGELQRVVAAEL